jgi:hypothetical protein
MNTRRPSRLAVALLDHCIPGNDPLTGDLIETAHHRGDAWFWRQVLLAILTRPLSAWRADRGSTTATALVALSLLAVIGFQAVVAASLVNQLLILNDPSWLASRGHYQSLQPWFAFGSVIAAALAGRAIGAIHRMHRVSAVLAFGACATLLAVLHLLLFIPNAPLEPLLPQPAVQTAVTMLFVGGLFAGMGSRTTCADQQLS